MPRPSPPPSLRALPWARWRARAIDYALLIRLHRPIGIYLLLWPTLWALWIAAEGVPEPLLLGVFVGGVLLMRSAGCAINDYADRRLDPKVRRTRDRPIAAGRITPREALVVASVLSLAAFALVLLTNPLTIALSVVAVALAASYPYMKRFHHLPQVHLGAAFAWSIPMAFAAQTGTLPGPLAWLLFIGAVLWTTAYDTLYAMTDREDDIAAGAKSSAILFGESDRLIVGILQGLFLLDLALVGQRAGLGAAFYLSLVIAGGLVAYQLWLIRDREPQACFKAFLNNHWLGLIVFVGIALNYAWSPS